MAEKAASKKKPVGAKKAAPAKRRVSKGETLVCDVCGMSVVVEEVGDLVISEETTLLCCGKTMKAKSRKAKATKK